MFRNFMNMFHSKRSSKVAYLSRMHSPQQVVQGIDVCFDHAEMLMHGVQDVGIDDDDVDDICGLDA